ncbi:hypothetical protein WJX74_007644 [Apatococcus lobatus]|uniref:Protein MAK16 homolog n=1 Tax=Apatococcus lobatus TaxID=904363 RepID=A0AAW1RJM9_9CHLO
MQHDEVIWQVINHDFCSYKSKTKTQTFCRNEYNVTGLCNRSSCPLANSRYATIREENGRCYLYIKSIERAHMPNKMWQKLRLKSQYAQALEQIDERLAFWPKFLVHKNKQRLTKITQYLIRMRKLSLKAMPKLVPIASRKEKMERKKEAKAETAAQLEASIEKELLKRLQSGTYGDIYNFPSLQYNKLLDTQEEKEVEEEKKEAKQSGTGPAFVEDADSESEDKDISADEDEEEEEEEVEYVNDEDVDFSEEESDMEDLVDPAALDALPAATAKRKPGGDAAQNRRQRRQKLNIEYEREIEPQQRLQSVE